MTDLTKAKIPITGQLYGHLALSYSQVQLTFPLKNGRLYKGGVRFGQ